MKLQDHYDWIVLGNHPAALLSASLVARLGLSALVLPLTSTMGFYVSSSGQYFDPESNYLIGLGKSGKIEGILLACLNKLGLLSSEEDLIDTQNSLIQSLTPASRFTLAANNEQLASEIQREFGKTVSKQLGLLGALKYSEAECLSFWYHLPKRLTLSSNRKPTSVEPLTVRDLRKKLSRNLGGTDPSLMSWVSSRYRISELSEELNHSYFADACAGLWYGITSAVNSDPVLFDLIHTLSLSRVGGSFKGGMSSYREFLVNLARRMGVHVPIDVECKRIFFEKGRFSGVQVGNRGSMISGGAGILGCSLEKAYQKATYAGRSWLVRKKRGLRPQGWKFTLAFTVHKEAIPNGMLSRVIWQENKSPFLEIEVVDPKDYSMSEDDSRVIYARTLMPYTAESLKPEFQRLIAARIMRQLTEILPFLEFHVMRIYPDFRLGMGLENSLKLVSYKGHTESGNSSKNELSEVYGFTSLDAIPENLLMFTGEGLGSSTGIDGFFIATDESYPHLGNLGPTVAALESVAWLAHRSGLAGPFV